MMATKPKIRASSQEKPSAWRGAGDTGPPAVKGIITLTSIRLKPFGPAR